MTELLPSLDLEIQVESKTNPTRNSGNTAVVDLFIYFFDICFVKEIKNKYIIQ